MLVGRVGVSVAGLRTLHFELLGRLGMSRALGGWGWLWP